MARHPKNSTPKLTTELIKSLGLAIRNGAYVETASALCGISRDTFYRWLRKAEEEDADELLKKLSDTVKKGLAQAEMRDLAVIDKAAQDGEWTAAAWRLERKFPDRWERQARVQLEHSGRESIDINMTFGLDLTNLSTSELRSIEKALKLDEQDKIRPPS